MIFVAAFGQSHKKPTPPNRSATFQNLILIQRINDQFNIFLLLLRRLHPYRILRQMKIFSCIFRIEKNARHISHKIYQITMINKTIIRRYLNRFRQTLGNLNALFHLGLMNFFVPIVNSIIKIIVIFHRVRLTTKPSIKTLLLPISLPHSQHSTQFPNRWHSSNNLANLLESSFADAHGFHNFGIDYFFIHKLAIASF